MGIKEQINKDRYSIINGDCMDVLPELDDDSIDLICYSPPFAGLFSYSSDPRDLSNCDSKEHFLSNSIYVWDHWKKLFRNYHRFPCNTQCNQYL